MIIHHSTQGQRGFTWAMRRAWLWSMFGWVWFVWDQWPFPAPVLFFFFRTFWPFDIAQFFLVYELQVILRATSPFLGVYIKIQLRKPGAIMLLHYLFLLIFWGQSVKSMWNILTFSFLNKAKHTMRKYYFGDYFFTLKINCCTQYTYKIRWEYLKF